MTLSLQQVDACKWKAHPRPRVFTSRFKTRLFKLVFSLLFLGMKLDHHNTTQKDALTERFDY